MNPAATSARERGQATVLTVVFLAVLLGMAALVLDVGSWFREKRQLQTAADAAALAGAQALPEDTSRAAALAAQYASTNKGASITPDVTISGANNVITVKTSSKAPGFFSKVFGIDSVDVGASAKARVDIPVQAQYVAPMVVYYKHPLLGGSGCPCYHQETTLDYDPMGAPGAFGMLNLDGGSGTPGSSDEAAWIERGFDKYLPLGKYRSDPGAKFSSQNIRGSLDDRIGTVLLFPVYKVLTGSGQNATYDIIGWVGFYLESYEVHGNNSTLHGYFTTFIAHGIQSSTGTTQPNFGVRSVQLIG
jgi:secretion/DNA translocation related TadE-like protein